MNDGGSQPSRRSILAFACLLVFPNPLRAQQGDEPAPALDVPTLERVVALRPEGEILDLYRHRNLVPVEPNRFDRVYNPGLSPEQVALEQGGYVNYGLNLGLRKSWQGIKKMTGMRADFQPVAARPPPLSAEQLRRAATMCGSEMSACPHGQ